MPNWLRRSSERRTSCRCGRIWRRIWRSKLGSRTEVRFAGAFTPTALASFALADFSATYGIFLVFFNL